LKNKLGGKDNQDCKNLQDYQDFGKKKPRPARLAYPISLDRVTMAQRYIIFLNVQQKMKKNLRGRDCGGMIKSCLIFTP